MALSITGRIYSWGADLPIQYGQDVSEINQPKDKMGWTFKDKISYIAAGDRLTSAITENGGLYIWGDNRFQQITNLKNRILSSGRDSPNRSGHYPERSLILLPTLFEIGGPVDYIDFGDKFTVSMANDRTINLWGAVLTKPTVIPVPHN